MCCVYVAYLTSWLSSPVLGVFGSKGSFERDIGPYEFHVVESMGSEWGDVFSKVVVLALLGPMGLQQCYNYTYGLLFTLKCVWREFAGPYRLRGVCS